VAGSSEHSNESSGITTVKRISYLVE
jgi:hypothetical protein